MSEIHSVSPNGVNIKKSRWQKRKIIAISEPSNSAGIQQVILKNWLDLISEPVFWRPLYGVDRVVED